MREECGPIKACGQTIIPEVDNTLDNCENISTDKCLRITSNLLKVNSRRGDTLDTVLKNIVDKTDNVTNDFIVLRPVSQPTNPTGGMVYTDNQSGKLRHYNGVTNSWEDLT